MPDFDAPDELGGSYFERAFIEPLLHGAFTTVADLSRGFYRGITGRSIFGDEGLVGSVSRILDDLAPESWADVPGIPIRAAGHVIGGAAAAGGYVAGRLLRGAGKLIRAGARGAGSLLAATPGIATGMAAGAMYYGAGALEMGARAARAIWNSPLLEKTNHWTGRFGMKQWRAGAEGAIIGGAVAIGAFRGWLAAYNAERLGLVDVGQLEGTITPARPQRDRAVYDNDADGSLVFALHRLRRG